MGKIKLKIDKSKLPDEFIFKSDFINNEEDLNTELGWSEIVDSVVEKLIIETEFVGDIDFKCKLKIILTTMDIPESRRNLDNSGNIDWLLRNIGIRNRNHADYNVAIDLLRKIK